MPLPWILAALAAWGGEPDPDAEIETCPAAAEQPADRPPCALSCPSGTTERALRDDRGCVTARWCVDAEDRKHGPELACETTGMAAGEQTWEHGRRVGPRRAWWWDAAGVRQEHHRHLAGDAEILACTVERSRSTCEVFFPAVFAEAPPKPRLVRGEASAPPVAQLDWAFAGGEAVAWVGVEVPRIPAPYQHLQPLVGLELRGDHGTVEVTWHARCPPGYPGASPSTGIWDHQERVGVALVVPESVRTLSVKSRVEAPPIKHCSLP